MARGFLEEESDRLRADNNGEVALGYAFLARFRCRFGFLRLTGLLAFAMHRYTHMYNKLAILSHHECIKNAFFSGVGVSRMHLLFQPAYESHELLNT